MVATVQAPDYSASGCHSTHLLCRSSGAVMRIVFCTGTEWHASSTATWAELEGHAGMASNSSALLTFSWCVSAGRRSSATLDIVDKQKLPSGSEAPSGEDWNGTLRRAVSCWHAFGNSPVLRRGSDSPSFRTTNRAKASSGSPEPARASEAFAVSASTPVNLHRTTPTGT